MLLSQQRENETSLFFYVEHGWASNDPYKWYQSYGRSSDDVVDIGGTIHDNLSPTKLILKHFIKSLPDDPGYVSMSREYRRSEK